MAAAWGTMVHKWVETGEVIHADKRTATAFKKAIALSGVDRAELWPPGGIHEGSLSLRIDGCREASRDDTERMGWITGHHDFQWWMIDELWIDDLKTNKLYPNPGPDWPGHIPEIEVGDNRFPPKADSEQQRLYGLAVSELLGYKGGVHVSITHWPRLPLYARHSPPTRLWHYYTRAELEHFWRELEIMYQTAFTNRLAVLGHEAPLQLNPGKHCKFCPAIDCMVRNEG